ncbi:hypothetical protein BDY21DRAFT_145672 [Lineolata rhizophorae]|uniref:Uncharacterized protein n=1 Tax=Lineolata rhizophorae TaxID=578093 RepID=A0A6A6NNT5_9PEZI|nr:hypothetical protein BDY21DRAFT_145672 [Lineolata rhizophorae]
MLQARTPTRVSVFLRKKSPLYSDAYDEVARTASSTLDIPPPGRCRLLAVQVWPRLTVLVFDAFHDGYDAAAAHHVADLPARVNVHVAKQHNYHGWAGQPPYVEDQTGRVPPTYSDPRDASML